MMRPKVFAAGLLRWLPLVPVLILPAGVAVSAAPDAAQERARLEALRDTIGGLHARIRAKRGEQSQLSAALAEAEKTIGGLAGKLHRLESSLRTRRGRVDELHILRGRQQAELAGQRLALARQVRSAYVMGRQERLKILLSQQDPSAVSRMMVYYDYLNRARAERMAVIRTQLERLAATEEKIVEGERELTLLLERQRQELSALEASQSARREVLARLNREIAGQDRELDRLKADERDLKVLIRGLEEALSDIPAGPALEQRFARLRGKLPWPAKGRIARRFGSAKLGNLVWDGVMISAPEGGEVRAVHHGRVAFADWLRGFGLLMIVEHGDGYMTLYGHNQSLFKEAGDWVEANEPVALIGNSGGLQSSGVYFGIRHQGRAVNPAKWCRKSRSRSVG